jgi:KTSC domain
MRFAMHRLVVAFVSLSFAGVTASAEDVCIKYHKCISVEAFKCDTITRSTAIHRVCYLESERYMVLWFKRRNGGLSEPYHFCELGSDLYKEFMAAPSMGTFYNQRIGGSRNRHGAFDCRDHPIPSL